MRGLPTTLGTNAIHGLLATRGQRGAHREEDNARTECVKRVRNATMVLRGADTDCDVAPSSPQGPSNTLHTYRAKTAKKRQRIRIAVCCVADTGEDTAVRRNHLLNRLHERLHRVDCRHII